MRYVSTICLALCACTVVSGLRADVESVTAYCRDRSFAVPYASFDLGAGKVVEVRLFARRKGQNDWQPAGARRDGMPIEFVPPSDGTWQFMTVGVNAAGLVEEKDRVELEVIFDRTPPTVRILEPRPGEVLRAGTELTVRWVVEDRHMAPDGAAVYAVEDPNSSLPWHIVSRPAPLRGTVTWTVPEVPRQDVTLHLEAIDKAGNVAVEKVPLKLVNERIRPSEAVASLVAVRKPGDVTDAMRKLARQLAELAPTLEAKGEIVKAETSLQRAFQLNPYDVSVVLTYAKFLARRERTDDAIAVLEKACVADENQIDLQFALAESYWQTGRQELAAIAYKKVIHTDADTRNVHVAYRRLIDRAVRQCRNQEAMTLIGRYLDTAKLTDEDRRNLNALRQALKHRNPPVEKPAS